MRSYLAIFGLMSASCVPIYSPDFSAPLSFTLERDTLELGAGESWSIPITVARPKGYAGAVQVSIEGPSSLTVSAAAIAEGSSTGVVTVTASDAAVSPATYVIHASLRDLHVSRTLTLSAVTQPRLIFDPASVSLPRGQSRVVTVHAYRGVGIDMPLAVALASPDATALPFTLTGAETAVVTVTGSGDSGAPVDLGLTFHYRPATADTLLGGGTASLAAHLTPRPGALDTTYGHNGFVALPADPNTTLGVVSLLLDSDRALAIGISKSPATTGDPLAHLARFDSTGAADPSYGTNGSAFFDGNGTFFEVASSVADGTNVLIVGSTNNETLVRRITREGDADPTYAAGMAAMPLHNSVGFDIARLADGRSVVLSLVGPQLGLTLLSASGVVETNFGASGTLLVTPPTDGAFGDGIPREIMAIGSSVFVMGYLQSSTSFETFISRYDIGAVADAAPAFASPWSNIIVPNSFEKMVADSTGDLILAGEVPLGNGLLRGVLSRRHASDGSVDTTFGANGTQELAVGVGFGADNLIGVQVLADGHILAEGCATIGATKAEHEVMVVRLLSSGQLDTSFGASGASLISVPGSISSCAVSAAEQSDGKIVFTASLDNPANTRLLPGESGYAIARLWP